MYIFIFYYIIIENKLFRRSYLCLDILVATAKVDGIIRKKRNIAVPIIAVILILLLAGGAVWLFLFDGLKTLGLTGNTKNIQEVSSAEISGSPSSANVNEEATPQSL